MEASRNAKHSDHHDGGMVVKAFRRQGQITLKQSSDFWAFEIVGHITYDVDLCLQGCSQGRIGFRRLIPASTERLEFRRVAVVQDVE